MGIQISTEKRKYEQKKYVDMNIKMEKKNDGKENEHIRARACGMQAYFATKKKLNIN